MPNKRKSQTTTQLDFGKDIFNAFKSAFYKQFFGGLDYWFDNHVTWNPVQSKDVPSEVLEAHRKESRNIKN